MGGAGAAPLLKRDVIMRRCQFVLSEEKEGQHIKYR